MCTDWGPKIKETDCIVFLHLWVHGTIELKNCYTLACLQMII